MNIFFPAFDVRGHYPVIILSSPLVGVNMVEGVVSFPSKTIKLVTLVQEECMSVPDANTEQCGITLIFPDKGQRALLRKLLTFSGGWFRLRLKGTNFEKFLNSMSMMKCVDLKEITLISYASNSSRMIM